LDRDASPTGPWPIDGGGGGSGGSTFGIAPVPVSTSIGRSGWRATAARSRFTTRLIQTDGEASQESSQWIGGGGGDGSPRGSSVLSPVPVIGGSGGGGAGGHVTVTNHASGAVVTNGRGSTAIFAQSIGGGGGTASLAFAASISQPVPFFLGGSGGAGGAGGVVTVVNDGALVINGEGSVGILAQSVGGGGGATFELLGVPIALGGQTGAIGDGGNVTVTNNGSIVLNGDNSIGIFAQSIGGGGGLVLPGSGAIGVTTNAGGTGNGGVVTVTNTAGAIMVTGNNSAALYAQSVGGGGGVAGTSLTPAQVGASVATNATTASAGAAELGGVLFSGSAGGHGVAAATTLNQTGHLIATGLNSSALIVQSHAPGGNGDITINILNLSPGQQSYIIGGTGTGAAVFIMDGARNRLNNAGLIASMHGADGFAIRGGTGDDTVVNSGTIVGSIDLGSGANSLVNSHGATFLSGVTLNLGTGTLTNEGLFSPGGMQRVAVTSLTGSFEQAAGGTYQLDLNLGSLTADRVERREAPPSAAPWC
jgi:hypothetical protein